MRLIDADLLKQNCKITGTYKDDFIGAVLVTFAEVIDNQPTAYNVDQVIEDIDREGIYIVNAQGKPVGSWLDTNRAKELVRAGGQEVLCNGMDK